MIALLDDAYSAADLDVFGFHYPDVDCTARETAGALLLTLMTEAASEWLALHVATF